MGAIADWHDLGALVTAGAAVAHGHGLDVHFLLIGEGPSRQELRDHAWRMGLQGRITMPGSVPHDQVPHYLAAADLCILPRANW